jgi:hypothetical protein
MISVDFGQPLQPYGWQPKLNYWNRNLNCKKLDLKWKRFINHRPWNHFSVRDIIFYMKGTPKKIFLELRKDQSSHPNRFQTDPKPIDFHQTTLLIIHKKFHSKNFWNIFSKNIPLKTFS